MVVAAGQGLMFCVVAPLLHEYVYGLVPPVPLEVTAAQAPGQAELPVAVTAGPALQLVTYTLLVTVAVHPAFVTVCVTLYVPAERKVYEKFVVEPETNNGEIDHACVPVVPVCVKFTTVFVQAFI